MSSCAPQEFLFTKSACFERQDYTLSKSLQVARGDLLAEGGGIVLLLGSDNSCSASHDRHLFSTNSMLTQCMGSLKQHCEHLLRGVGHPFLYRRPHVGAVDLYERQQKVAEGKGRYRGTSEPSVLCVSPAGRRLFWGGLLST